ncbi:AAA domain [Carpediemonas membranifera]|uniref:AAA domain n=1 Tax=Carpediemonas membranifera TaxID=201153 RepID=A0A8J6E207_9EUKA|nr:AAA domain [Carpediemonas membranifera]|eukprot:KAG9394103.1 AAA domain [Carpediemonas membranifera]
MSSKRIFGLVGLNGAGKSYICAHLKSEFEYDTCSLSDAIRDELRANNMPITRENLIQMGNQMREQYGPDVLAERVAAKVKQNRLGFAIDSIRNPAEVEALRRHIPGFTLLYISASEATRYDRLCLRSRPGDEELMASIDTFRAYEAREREGSETMQQLDKVIAMADAEVDNEIDSNLSALLERLVLDGR